MAPQRSATVPNLIRLVPRSSAARGDSTYIINGHVGSGSNEAGHLSKSTSAGYLESVSSRSILTAAAILYLLACILVPIIVSDIRAANAMAAANTEPLSLDFSAASASTSSSFRNRRMSMQLALPKHRHHQDYAGPADEIGEIESVVVADNEALIEYKEAGLRVPLLHALNASHWNEFPIYGATTSDLQSSSSEYLLSTIAPQHPPEDLPPSCPQGAIRIFVAINSRCCTAMSRSKRDIIRYTWLNTILEDFGGSMRAAFVLSQPAGDDAAVLEAATFLQKEAAENDDLVIIPGLEGYRQLPEKTLRTLRYALSSPCKFTHFLKTDDDVYLRPQKLLNIVLHGEREWEFDILNPKMKQIVANAVAKAKADAKNAAAAVAGVTSETLFLQFDGRKPGEGGEERRNNDTTDISSSRSIDAPAAAAGGPWMKHMYVGKLEGNQSSVFLGWRPLRDEHSKWGLTQEELSDADLIDLLGARWAGGYGYMLSRDVTEAAWSTAVKHATSDIEERPRWWGRLPWYECFSTHHLNFRPSITFRSFVSCREDILMANLLKDVTPISHHSGFKAAWEGCDEGTVLKHLDIDAPALTLGLHEQELSRLWELKGVVCYSGRFGSGDYSGWQKWRNTFQDNIENGFM